MADANRVLMEIHKAKLDCDTLMSYWFTRPGGRTGDAMMVVRELPAIKHGKFYLDSGVFSARKAQTTIPLEDLIRFYHDNRSLVDYVFNMDEGTATTQLNNCKTLKREEVPVIGIWHGGIMPLEMLEDFFSISDYLAISFFATGGPSDNTRVIPYLDGFWNYMVKHSLLKCKVHALGTERFDLMIRYPFYSCDSAGFTQQYAFFKMTKFDPLKRKGFQGTFLKKTPLKALSMDWKHTKQIIQDGQEARFARALFLVRERIKMQKVITDTWKARGIEWENDCLPKV